MPRIHDTSGSGAFLRVIEIGPATGSEMEQFLVPRGEFAMARFFKVRVPVVWPATQK